jgi:hypothetical protein
MKMGSTHQTTVSNGKWCVGTCSGSGIKGVRFEPFMPPQHNGGKYRYPASHGTIFPTQEAATQFSIEQGFSQPFYPRPSAFITLKLSPATRRYLRSITNITARWDALEKVVGSKLDIDGGRYFRGVRFAEYAANTRVEWNLYLDGDFEQLRRVRSGQLAHKDVVKQEVA